MRKDIKEKKRRISIDIIISTVVAIIIASIILLSTVIIVSCGSRLTKKTIENEEEIVTISPTVKPNKNKQEKKKKEPKTPKCNIEGENPGGTIYLTFDDGPSVETTGDILDVLKEKGVKATFFVIDYGKNKEKKALIKREIDEGHSVGLHGMSHEYRSVYKSEQSAIKSFTDFHEKILKDFNYDTNIIRFPGGSSNTVSKKYCKGIMTKVTKEISDLGYVYFDWNVDCDDAGSARTANQVLENIKKELWKGHNNFVLLHDIKPYTRDAIKSVIDYGLQNGYDFRCLSSEVEPIHHGINN